MSPRIRFAALALVASSFAGASDGTFQISQVCAAIGCFPGDSGGLPVTITQPGSYRLTSNISTSSLETNIIEIGASNVSIDLNGFSLTGPVSCSGSPLVCTGQSSSVSTGLGISAGAFERLAVHGGHVSGMGGSGVRFNGSSTLGSPLLYDMTLSQNGRSGLVIQFGLVRDVIAEFNRDNGISTFLGSVYVRDSIVRGNRAFGIGAGSFCSGVVSTNNDSGTNCVGIGPNVCETPTNCD